MNLNTPVSSRLLIGILAIAAVGVAGRYGIGHLQAVARANDEARLEEPEIVECKKRLAMIYNAWKAYKADHKGAEPQGINVLIPKYIKDPNTFLCPTAARMIKTHVHVNLGGVSVNGRSYPESYGFRWLSAGFPRFLKEKGDEIPLIICSAHREATYFAAYSKLVQDIDFKAAHRGSLMSAVRDAPYLAARRDGKVEAIDTTQD